jgi:hypothetical protein
MKDERLTQFIPHPLFGCRAFNFHFCAAQFEELALDALEPNWVADEQHHIDVARSKLR